MIEFNSSSPLDKSMADEKEEVREEWQVTIPQELSSSQMEFEPNWISRIWTSLEEEGGRIWNLLLGFLQIIASKVSMFAKKTGADDPRKVIHGVKVGIALTVVSLFYYVRPLYDCVGGSGIWAVMTVAMVFEFTVGGCLYKGFNRAMATLCAAGLAVGIHWIASHSGEKLKPIILFASVFLLGSAATFCRYIPAVKARFEYGVIIFTLTFSLVAVSGFRVDELLQLGEHRASTVAIGICICVLICILICPVWSGEELHLLVSGNMEKLADSLEGYVAEYFTEAGGNGAASSGKLQGYKCVLNGQASENSQASLARWEMPHGRFRFRHPWSQYLKVGAAMRHCAYCIEALHGCTLPNTVQASGHMKKHLGTACVRLGSDSSKVLRELSSSFKSMKKSETVGLQLIGEMKDAVFDVRHALESFGNQLTPAKTQTPLEATEEKQQPVVTVSIAPLTEAMPVITAASLLMEIAERIDGVVSAVNVFADLACFDSTDEVKGKQPCSAAPQPQEVGE